MWTDLTSGRPWRPRVLAQAAAGVPSPPLCGAHSSSPHRAMGLGTGQQEGVRSVAGRMSAGETGLLREDTQGWFPAGRISQEAFGPLVEEDTLRKPGVLLDGGAGLARRTPCLFQSVPGPSTGKDIVLRTTDPTYPQPPVIIFEGGFPVLDSWPSGRPENS